MMRRLKCIALIACISSPSLLVAQSNSPEQFQKLLARDAVRSLDRPTVEATLQDIIDQLALSEEDKAALSEAVLLLVDSIQAGDIEASFQAAKDLEQLIKDLHTKYQTENERGIFGTAKAVWKLATAIHAGDKWGIAKAIWDLVWSFAA